MTIYSLDILLFLFGTSLLFHVQFYLLLPDLHTDFSGGRSGGLLFPSLSEFSTVCCDPHKGFGIVNKAEVDVLLFTQGPIYGEGMKIMATSFKRSHACTAALSAPALQQATADPRLHWRLWTLTGKPGSVSRAVTAPFSWVLVCTRFCCDLQESISQSCVSSGGSMVGLMATSSKRAYVTPRSTAPRAPASAAVRC